MIEIQEEQPVFFRSIPYKGDTPDRVYDVNVAEKIEEMVVL